MHCLSCNVPMIRSDASASADLCDSCRVFWERGTEDIPEEPRRDIIPAARREECAMPSHSRCGARHIAAALRKAARLGGRLDPAGTRLEAEWGSDGMIYAAAAPTGGAACVPAWYAHMIRAPVPGAWSTEIVDWESGRDAVAWTLGFDGSAELMAWAEAHPDLWGGAPGLALLDPTRADGCPITTLEDAARVFDGLACS